VPPSPKGRAALPQPAASNGAKLSCATSTVQALHRPDAEITAEEISDPPRQVHGGWLRDTVARAVRRAVAGVLTALTLRA
jgi:hypothetical protein